MCMEKRMKAKRKEAGLTQEELAHALGLQKSAIAKYESGRVRNIKQDILIKMAQILDCSPAYLMGWSDTPDTQHETASGAVHASLQPDFSVETADEKLLIEIFCSLEEDSRSRVLEYCRSLKKIQDLEKGL